MIGCKAAMDDAETMEGTLEAAGAAGIDIVPALYERFFARFPEAVPLFLTFESNARMAGETIDLLLGLARGEWWVETSVESFVDLHRNYGEIPGAQWDGFVDLLIETLAEAAGEDWTAQAEAAWRRQASDLKEMIARFRAAAG